MKLINEFEYDRALLHEIARQKIYDISFWLSKNSSTSTCFVLGKGKQSRYTYTSLKQKEGVIVINYDSPLPFFFKALGSLTSSYFGLVKINDPSLLPEITEELGSQAMVRIYIFNVNYEAELVDVATTDLFDFDALDRTVRQDNSFLIYEVDEDRLESDTNVNEYILFGEKCPNELRNIILV